MGAPSAVELEERVKDRAAPVARPPDPDFDAVFREFAPYVLRLLARLGVAAGDVDDVGQEVFVTIARRLPDFEGRAAMRTWIYGIVMRHAANYRRGAARARNHFGVPAADAVEPAAQASQARAVEARQGLALAERLISELPQTLRDVFVLFEIEGLDMRDVARVLECPIFTAYGRLYAARRRVRQGLRRQLGGGGR